MIFSSKKKHEYFYNLGIRYVLLHICHCLLCTIAPMYLLQTWAFIPTAAVMFLIAVFFYRKTGRIYLSSLVLAALDTWIMVVGTVMDPYVL